MPEAALTILHLEDSPNDALLIASLIEKEVASCRVLQVDSREAFLQAVRNPDVRIVLSDYALPTYDGMTALSESRNLRPELPFIFISGAMGEDMAVECMKIGATDYVLKSNLKRLPGAIQRALREMDTRVALLEAARIAKVVPWQWDDSYDTWLFGYHVRDILGYLPGDLKATPGFLRAKIHVDDLPRFSSSFDLAKTQGRLDCDCRLWHVEGRWIWTRWTLAWSGGCCRGVLQDISELRSTQDALIQSQRLESLGTMICGITHDFGNLIMTMGTAAYLLAKGELTPTQRGHVDILSKSCERALEFKNELMQLSRKEDVPSRVALHLNEMAQEAVTLLSHTLPKSVELTLDLCPDLPLIQAIPGQILQVVMNLAINARDAMEGSGKLVLRTGIAELHEMETAENHRPEGRYAYLEIEDTGSGIPSELLPCIFEPFFTTKEKGQGTGLGLPMVRAIVQQHDGLLRVHSEPGVGTRFTVLFPECIGLGTK